MKEEAENHVAKISYAMGIIDGIASTMTRESDSHAKTMLEQATKHLQETRDFLIQFTKEEVRINVFHPVPDRIGTTTPVLLIKKFQSTKYDRCRGCGTQDKTHQGDGYCTTCYSKHHPRKDRSDDQFYSKGEVEHALEKEKAAVKDPVINMVDRDGPNFRKKRWGIQPPDDEPVYCSYSKCPERGKQFSKKDMYRHDYRWYHSMDCVSSYEKDKKEGTEDTV